MHQCVAGRGASAILTNCRDSGNHSLSVFVLVCHRPRDTRASSRSIRVVDTLCVILIMRDVILTGIS